MNKIYVLMKNGWPVSVFDSEYEANKNLDAAQLNEPCNHWMLLDFVMTETY